MSKCLLVIDMQEITVGDQHAGFFKYDQHLINRVNTRISAYETNRVIYIIQLMHKNFVTNLLPFKAFEGSAQAGLADKLRRVNDVVIKKYEGDAFSNPDLLKILRENTITEVELVGIDGGGCIAATAQGALRNGFKVIVNEAAVGTMFKHRAAKFKINQAVEF